MTIGSRWKKGGIAALAVLVLAACGSEGGTDDLGLADATGEGTDPSTTTSSTLPVPTDPAAMCTAVFQAWSSGDLATISRLLTASAVGELATRQFSAPAFGLAGNGSDCFITEYDPTGGGLTAIGDLTISTEDAGLLVSALTWNPAGSLPAPLTDRLMRSNPLVFPGGTIATTIPGAVPNGSEVTAPAPGVTVPGPTTGSEPLPGPSTGSTTTVAPAATLAPAPRTTLPPAAPTTPVVTVPPPTTAATTTTIAPTLQQASDTALAEDCANAYQPACAELERRHAPAAGDATVANGFADAVINGDLDAAGAAATPGLLNFVPALRSGPYPPIDGIDVPGTTFDTASGRLQFRVTATGIVRCYVAAGLVRHCSAATG